ncbi:glycosyl hydrolase family 76 protein [Aspergillus eucalypticola CBS 122712]|uniref:Mannan endo-1,6-alpha-mannosidase n=1 Tax=Aspergillus eucalypticola (strain CBS 122712 / IBT 29274) TaxID=1448314 RepID=A0A317ULS5_ASPEC|nr:glycosyl hydrolase family 76 protein [Aspergillus eucalypticola CBS 122712]PWY62435.1 glycosyl hydrolase family 76 protein [Aspergillus eucalypticola CBS 122712]
MAGNQWLRCVLVLALAVLGVQGISLDISSEDSVKNAASTAAYGMMKHYKGNESGEIPGKIPNTWWEGGAMFMTLMQYYHYTGDSTYNKEVIQGMQWQSGDCDFMPANWSSYIGNDDQMFWGLAAMTGAELNFPDSSDGYSWLSLAQGVFNTQVARWDNSTCDGGMRWQIYTYESGYTMKNAISNGGLFQLSARLARYTSNQTYYDWAERIYDWSTTTPLLSNSTWNVADSTSTTNDCSSQGDNQWSYNYGAYLGGAAYMYNYTNGTSTKWLNAVEGLLNRTLDKFFPESHGGEILTEILCEPLEVCNDNEIIFKGLVSAWLAYTALLVPSTYNRILPKLQGSAKGAAATCTGYGNNTCGVRWWNSTWDGWSGLEEQMSVTSVFSANMIAFNSSSAPLTSSTGGNSTSDPSAGTDDSSDDETILSTITTGDRAGAGIVTVAFAGGWIGLMVWLMLG